MIWVMFNYFCIYYLCAPTKYYCWIWPNKVWVKFNLRFLLKTPLFIALSGNNYNFLLSTNYESRCDTHTRTDLRYYRSFSNVVLIFKILPIFFVLKMNKFFFLSCLKYQLCLGFYMSFYFVFSYWFFLYRSFAVVGESVIHAS